MVSGAIGSGALFLLEEIAARSGQPPGRDARGIRSGVARRASSTCSTVAGSCRATGRSTTTSISTRRGRAQRPDHLRVRPQTLAAGPAHLRSPGALRRRRGRPSEQGRSWRGCRRLGARVRCRRSQPDWRPFSRQSLELEPPDYFGREQPDADRMSYTQLAQLRRRSSSKSGFDVVRLDGRPPAQAVASRSSPS